jgi:hypothetical protein
MRLFEFTQPLTESVTFSVGKLITDNPDFPNGLVSGAEFETKGEEECWTCDGKGYEEYNGKQYTCGHCNGTKKLEKWITPYEELNISNSNAAALLDVLGIPQGDDGTIGQVEYKDLPTLRRKLIKLKNGDMSELTTPPQTDHGQMRKSKDENGLTQIGRGPTIHHGGRDLQQVQRYVDRLLHIIDFAQKNNAMLIWG